VRVALYGAALLALAALVSLEALRCILATAASALFEATPFVLAGMAAARVLRWPHAAAYLGCGCAPGPSARSLPAAAATWLVFGPVVALARLGAAILAARLLPVERPLPACAPEAPDLLDELAGLLAPALCAGAATQLPAALDPARFGPLGSAAAGALLGFAAAPCALGAVAMAGALHARAPLGAAAFLCVAGIADLRALRRRPHAAAGRDAFAYVLLATALALVAVRRGDALVHPAITPALGASALAAAILAAVNRRRESPARRWAPLLMLAGALVTAPPPRYFATETTLSDLFAGERLTFTGMLTRDGTRDALIRYAITCCRADAVPVVVRLDRALPYAAGSWLRAQGQIESVRGDLRLVPGAIARIAPPGDPFIYR
jgi:hypothetical protein